MSHELSIRDDGFVEMAYIGKVPWHHYGNCMAKRATKEQWRKASGFDHTVEWQPLRYRIGSEEFVLKDRRMLYRSDTGRPLGIVSDEYNIVQPAEVLDFFDDLIQSLGLELETAGMLYGGKQYWVLARIGEEAVLPDDSIKGFLLLSTSVDGSRRTCAKATSMRVVCDNTLRMSDSKSFDTGAVVAVSHRQKFDADKVKEQLGFAPKTFETFMADLRTLAHTPLTRDRAEEMTLKLFDDAPRTTATIMSLFDGGATGADIPGVGGTAWAWLNSVTQQQDHMTRTKSASHRIDSSLFGVADSRKAKAFKMAMALAD